MSGMYKSIINREYVLSQAFAKYKVHEVYANVDHTMGVDNPDLVVLMRCLDDIEDLHTAVYSVYPGIKSCSITCNPKHPSLKGKKIIYRDGVWYV